MAPTNHTNTEGVVAEMDMSAIKTLPGMKAIPVTAIVTLVAGAEYSHCGG